MRRIAFPGSPKKDNAAAESAVEAATPATAGGVETCSIALAASRGLSLGATGAAKAGCGGRAAWADASSSGIGAGAATVAGAGGVLGAVVGEGNVTAATSTVDAAGPGRSAVAKVAGLGVAGRNFGGCA